MNSARIQRGAELLFAVLAGGFAVQVILVGWDHGFETARLVVLGLTLALVWGLARGRLWGRRAATVLCLLVAIGLPGAYLSPFAAGDAMAQGLAPPTIGELMVWIVPVEIFVLGLAWALDLRPVNTADRPPDGPPPGRNPG